MASNILMPGLTPTMEDGTIASWLVKEGDTVSPGDVIAEIETDKAVIELEAAESGVIDRIVAREGSEGIKVDAVIAILRQEGESDLEDIKPRERIKSSPAARHLALNTKIDISKVRGTGPGNRVLKSDVNALVREQESHAGIATAHGDQLPDIPYEERRMTGMRKVIAQRMQASKRDIPHLYLGVDIEIDSLLQTRRVFNAAGGEWKATINDFIVRAIALALRKVPSVNAQLIDNKHVFFQRSDVAVAVAVNGGLVTPVVRGADTMDLLAISKAVKQLADKARNGKLLPEESYGGTITVSNVGMFGIKVAHAVINPPQAAIIAIGQGSERPIARDGMLAIATVLTATVSCDHRVIDGAEASEFLSTVKRLLEDPVQLVD